MEELRLHGCKELTDYSIEVLIKHQPSLQRLDISSCTELTSRTVEAVARGLKSLTHISLSNNWRITEKGDFFFFNLEDLVLFPKVIKKKSEVRWELSLLQYVV